ncbi:MAG: TIR domain-containing protein [Bacteroidetes bacterium]|nr:TIR domain-containing protein [Bacteroidota bacterium]
MLRNGIFISYAEPDLKWVTTLQTFLRPYTRDEKMEVIGPGAIQAGLSREQQVVAKLQQCRVVILLVSPEYLANDDIIKKDLPAIIKEQQTGELIVFPIAVSHSAYSMVGINQFPSPHDLDQPLDVMDKPERQKVLLQITNRIVNAMGINALGNMFKIIDDFVPRQQAFIEDREPDPVPPVFSAIAKQEEEKIELKNNGNYVFETITAAEFDSLDKDSKILIRTYETTMTYLFERWVELQPQSYSKDPQVRQDARDEMSVLRRDLCQQLNAILDLLHRMHKYLDDHYHHVRHICSI